MTLIESSVLAIAVLFFVLVACILFFLKRASKTFDKMDITFTTVQQQVEQIGNESRFIIQNTNDITCDIQRKIKCLEPLFHAFSNVGTGLARTTAAFKDVTVCPSCKEPVHNKQPVENGFISQSITVALSAVRMWNDFKLTR